MNQRKRLRSERLMAIASKNAWSFRLVDGGQLVFFEQVEPSEWLIVQGTHALHYFARS